MNQSQFNSLARGAQLALPIGKAVVESVYFQNNETKIDITFSDGLTVTGLTYHDLGLV